MAGCGWVGAALLVALSAPAAAQAGTVVLDGSVVRWTAAPGEINRLTISGDDSEVRLADAMAPIAAGAGCTPAGSGVACSGPVARAILEAGDGDDEVSGTTSVPLEIDGGAGTDALAGGSGDDVVRGGADPDQFGREELSGGSGDDRLVATPAPDGRTIFFDGPGDDTMVGGPDAASFSTGPGRDTYLGGPGPYDTVVINARPSGFTDQVIGLRVDLAAGEITAPGGERDAVSGVEDVNGGDGPDAIIGTDGPNGLDGARGDDVVDGRGGTDFLGGGAGNDTVDGGAGDDAMSGDWGDGSEPGDDHLAGGDGNDLLNAGGGFDTFDAGAGDDRLNTQDGVGGEAATCGEGSDSATIDTTDVAGADCETRSTAECGRPGGAPVPGVVAPCLASYDIGAPAGTPGPPTRPALPPGVVLAVPRVLAGVPDAVVVDVACRQAAVCAGSLSLRLVRPGADRALGRTAFRATSGRVRRVRVALGPGGRLALRRSRRPRILSIARFVDATGAVTTVRRTAAPRTTRSR